MIALYAPVGYAPAVADENPGIGENIKRARIAAGYATQSAFAKHLGVPQPQLSDWENGRYGTPDLSTLLRIAAAIPCSIDELIVGQSLSYDQKVIARRDPLSQPDRVQQASNSHGGDASHDLLAASIGSVAEELRVFADTASTNIIDLATRLEQSLSDASARRAPRTPRRGPSRRVRRDRKVG